LVAIVILLLKKIMMMMMMLLTDFERAFNSCTSYLSYT